MRPNHFHYVSFAVPRFDTCAYCAVVTAANNVIQVCLIQVKQTPFEVIAGCPYAEGCGPY